MFGLPEAKRIRRNEVLSPSSSTRSSPELNPAEDEEARAKLGKLLAFDTYTPEVAVQGKYNTQNEDIAAHLSLEKNRRGPDGGGVDAGADADDGEEEFEFRLFSAPSSKRLPDSMTNTAAKPSDSTNTREQEGNGSSSIKTQRLKIRLRSPTPDNNFALGDGRFVVPFRGWEYYFTRPELIGMTARDPSQLEVEQNKRREQFQDIAVTADEILDWAQTTTPGCHLPWRVMHLNPARHRVPKPLLLPGNAEEKRMATGFSALISSSTSGDTNKKKKSKPGKKRRVILRARAAATAATADMTEAEKRNKKNRQNKIRRRQKERERKAALASSNSVDAAPAGSEPSD